MNTNSTDTPPVCSYEGSDYQRTFWDSGERRYEDAVEQIALKRLLTKPGQLLLELGAGAGRNTPRYTGFERVVLLDYSRTQLLQARERLGDNPRYLYVAADIYKLPFVDGLFDGATMIRTLHHMAQPGLAIQSIRRVLRGNAQFLLEFANKRNLKSILRYLLGRQPWNPFSPEQVEFVVLNFDFHPKTIRRLLKENNFAIEKQLNVSQFRVAWLKKHVPLGILVGLDSALQWTGAFAQYAPSVWTLARAAGPSAQPANGGFFACPACGCALPEVGKSQTCSQCGHFWSYTDGIHEFRINPQV
ncbi:MAG TPA: class I SAM-dependent methyltransferase [Anaerolineaceae bacterium]|nr:class I SAM-dependent methyltransferase [Anaerolineaceae bacterium]